MRACCTTQGTLLSALWWPNGKDIQKKEDICKHIAVLLCYTIETNTGEGNGTPLQHSCLETPMDGGAWWAAVHGVAKSQTQLSDFTFTFHFHALEKEMATHSSVLAWKIPETGEPGGLPSLGLHSQTRLKRLSSSSSSSREAWCTAVYGVTKSWTQLSNWTNWLYTYLQTARITGLNWT